MKPELKNKQLFQKLLKDYRPSDDALAKIDHLKVVTLAGPSGAGRNTIIGLLVESGEYDFFISDTTRPKRSKDGVEIESDGNPYWFITEDQMLDQLQNGEMMEAAIIHQQQVSGTSIREFNRILEEDKIAISEIEPQGVDTYKKIRPQTIAIFVIPPSFDEWIARMESRAHMHKDELINRLESAEWELEWARDRDYYHIVVNDEAHHAAKEIDEIVKSNPEPHREPERLQLIEELISQTIERLKELKT